MSGQTRAEKAFYALISGRVQGVGFRYSAYREACRLGLSGWVRNKANGDVEVLAQGKQQKLDLFLAWLHRGPPGARVDIVQDKPVSINSQYSNFSIEH